jgi:predicted DNA-binding transcriptional regulator AlpA
MNKSHSNTSNKIESETDERLFKSSQNLKNKVLIQNQLLRIAEVSALTTLAKSTIALWESTGRFPKSIALSPTIKVWTLESISVWLEKAKT